MQLEAAERTLHTSEKSVLMLADLPPALPSTGALTPDRLYDRQAAAEREAILRAGRESAGHPHIAERLRISRATAQDGRMGSPKSIF